MRDFTVLTFNLLSPGHADWPRRRTQIRRGAAPARSGRRRPPGMRANRRPRRRRRSARRGVRAIWHSRRSADGVGAVLGSRHPVRQVREVDLRLTPRVTLPWAAAVLVEIELPAPVGPVLVAHHKPTYEHGYSHERELQAVACAHAVEEQVADRDRPVIVLGDFDDTPDSASLRFWTGRQALQGVSVCYRDAWAATRPTMPGTPSTRATPWSAPARRPSNSAAASTTSSFGAGSTALPWTSSTASGCSTSPRTGSGRSDHFGVLARLGVPDHPPGAWTAVQGGSGSPR